jgi:DNA-binding NtrC family response regulator
MKTSVLFVDDDERMRAAWRRSFSSEQYESLFAHCADSAFAICQKHHVQVVVSDYAMPGGSGLELFEALKGSAGGGSIMKILVSGQAGMRVASEALNLYGVFRLFEKPCPVSDLKLAIQTALAHATANPRRESESAELQALEREHPGISQVRRGTRGEILV